MAGQGAIIAVGAMDYPAEYRGVAAGRSASMLGISKVMTVTCTYDHRIIQGAESGVFLGTLQSLLDGENGFYEEIFAALRVPYRAGEVGIRTKASPASTPGAAREPAHVRREVVKEAAVIQLIHAFRVRGHLMAELDPLGARPAYNAELDPLTYGLTIWDLDREFYTGYARRRDSGASATLREMVELLRETYCGKIGCRVHVHPATEQKTGCRSAWSPRPTTGRSLAKRKLRILAICSTPKSSSTSCTRRYIGQKRFSLEGAETAIADSRRDLPIRAAENNVARNGDRAWPTAAA